MNDNKPLKYEELERSLLEIDLSLVDLEVCLIEPRFWPLPKILKIREKVKMLRDSVNETKGAIINGIPK